MVTQQVQTENKVDIARLLAKYNELHALYANTSKAPAFAEIELALMENRFSTANEMLNLLDDRKELLHRLSEILRHKPVYKTIKRINSGEITNKYELIKGYTSLMTHIAIECERGNEEYLVLLRDIHAVVSNLLMK